MLVLAVQSGLRVSELTALTRADVHLGTVAHVSCLGKGRKQRITPLITEVTATLRAWLTECAGQPTDPLFPTRRGTPLSPDAVQQRLSIHAITAADTCPTLTEKRCPRGLDGSRRCCTSRAAARRRLMRTISARRSSSRTIS